MDHKPICSSRTSKTARDNDMHSLMEHALYIPWGRRVIYGCRQQVWGEYCSTDSQCTKCIASSCDWARMVQKMRIIPRPFIALQTRHARNASKGI